MRKLLLIATLCILMAGCVCITGRDKQVLNRTAVWADSSYRQVKNDIESGKELNNQAILELLDSNRKMWAMFTGASEGKTSTEIIEELDDTEKDMFIEEQ